MSSEPLHFNIEMSPITTIPSRRRSRRNYKCCSMATTATAGLVLALLCLSSLINTADAKMLLVPKHQMRQGNKSHINGGNKKGKNEKKENRRHGLNNRNQQKQKQKKPLRNNAAQIVLQPRSKAAQPQTTEASANVMKSNALKLEATIHTNEQGEKVLKLTQESAEMVDNAMKMEEASDTVTDAEDATVEEDEPQQVLFYDPDDLKTAPGGVPLPRKVFDADGNEVDMGGKDAILIPPPPPHDPDHEHEHPKPPPPHEEEGDEVRILICIHAHA